MKSLIDSEVCDKTVYTNHNFKPVKKGELQRTRTDVRLLTSLSPYR